MRESIESAQYTEQREKRGKNVTTILKVIRHGERTPDGYLTDYGRDITRQRAKESGIKIDDFHAVKPGGSKSGPLDLQTNMPRSLETAEIYSEKIAGKNIFCTRPRKNLTFEALITPLPIKYIEIYNSCLPKNFDNLSNKKKSKASKEAQAKTFNALMNLDTPKAEQFKNEAAGSFATEIEFFTKRNNKLYSGSKVLEVLGSHGGLMEFILQKALVWKDDEGEQHIGLTDLNKINGEFDPSEAFNIEISTDQEGNLKPLKITFDNPQRPQGEMYLDSEKVKELSKFYQNLHKNEKENK